MAGKRTMGIDEIISINVGGKKYTTRRSTLAADPGSKLAEWFKMQGTRSVPVDKAGNYFLDRDGKSFRFILAYLRLKKEKHLASLSVPMKPDDLAKLIAESDALRLTELKDACIETLQRYHREERTYVHAYVNQLLKDYEQAKYDAKRSGSMEDFGAAGDAYGDSW